VPQRPTHDVPETHWPAGEQTSPTVRQAPHASEPPHPSEPHVRPVQSGTHVQTFADSQTPGSHASAQQSPFVKQSTSHWQLAAGSG